MVTRERLLAITLTLVMVTAAGCAGWGTDDPATGDQQQNDTEDLNDAENESTNASANSAGNQPNATDSDSENTSTSDTSDNYREPADDSSDESTTSSETESSESDQSSDNASDRDSTDREQDGDTGAHDDTSDTDSGSDSTDDTSTSDGDTKSDEEDQQDQKSDDGDQKSDGEKDQKEKKDKSETYTLTVTVLSPDDEPVEGMDVDLVTYDGSEHVATKTTDENGQVTFEVEPGDYELSPDVSESPHTEYGTHLVEVSEDTEYTINLDTPPNAENNGTDESDKSDEGENNGDRQDQITETERTLTVTVVDGDGNPIEDATVHATGPVLSNGVAHEPSGVTNENGVVKLTVYDGEYSVEAQHDGITSPVKQTVVVDGDTETTITIDRSDDKEGDEETHTLTVTVLDPDGEPVGEGMTVEIHTHPDGEKVGEATTDENGQVTFEVAPYGYELTPDVEGTEYTFYGNYLVGVEEDTEFTINLNSPPGADDDNEATTLTVNLAYDQVDGVEIKVWHTGSGEMDSTKVTKESQGGEATFELEPGHYHADAEGYVGTMSPIDVTEDTEITLQNESGTTVPIKVIDAGTGGPIEGAEISNGQCDLRHSTGEVGISGTTGEDGIAQAHADVTPTWCSNVRISADGYLDTQTTVSVPANQPVQVALKPAERRGTGGEEQHQLTMNAFDHEGNPLPNASVSVVTDDDGQDVASGTTNENGVATFDVIDGDYEVSVSHDDYEADGTGGPVRVLGEDTSVDVTMPEPNGDNGNGDETHQLTVNALDHEGNPLPNATVSVVTYDGGADVGSATTDENGQVTFELENGDYELGVSAPEQDLYQPSDQRLVSINGADEEFTIELQYSGNEPPDTATGVVRVGNDNGEPIEGEHVTITPPNAERESEKYQRVTDENGEVVIEREAKALDDFATYGVSVRGEEKELTIKSDSRHGVQEVEFNPTHRFYLFELVLQVVDENGEPIEGATVETRHGLFPDEYEVVGETDQYGEILLTGGSSEPTDVDARDIRVRGQTLRTSIDYERKVETMQIDTDATSDAANETSELSMNETASANATAALAIA